MAKSQPEKSRIVTPVFRVMFPYVFELPKPKPGFDANPKYEVTGVFDPKTFSPEDKKRWSEMKRIADEASMATFKRPLDKLPSTFKKPFRDGAEKEHLSGYGEGTIFCKFKSKFRPGIVASDGKTPIEDKEAFYSGCYARASITAFAYDNAGKGVSFWMQNLMFIKDGERLDGRVDASQDFGEFGGEEPTTEFDDLI